MTRGVLWGILMACWPSGGCPVSCAKRLRPGAGQTQQKTEDKIPVLLIADEVTYDRDLGVVTARGHVEISRGDRVVHADTVSYNERRRPSPPRAMSA